MTCYLEFSPGPRTETRPEVETPESVRTDPMSSREEYMMVQGAHSPQFFAGPAGRQ
jgi:hypothetical protein